jgi:putative DNA primase/helicase
MRQDFFTYVPRFKLVIIGNHKPALRSVDDAVRRRFQIVPFLHRPERPDRSLEKKLQSEWPAILRWAIEGCLEWQTRGLDLPVVVRDETEEYLAGQDLFGHWLEEHCVCEPSNRNLWTSVRWLYTSWITFAKSVGEDPGSMKVFTGELDQRGFPGKRKWIGGKQIRGRLGIALRERKKSATNDAGTDEDKL